MAGGAVIPPSPHDWRRLERWETEFDPQDGELVQETHIGEHNIRVLENPHYRWLCFNRLLQSGMLLAHPDALLFKYARTMIAFRLFVPAPARLLLLGLGAGSLMRYALRHLPTCELTAVDYSADVIAIAHAHFGLPRRSPRLTVVHRDARDHLHEPMPPQDVILVDLFGAQGTPPWMEDDALYHACLARLAPQGVLAVNLLAHDQPMLERLLAPITRVFTGGVLHTTPDEYDNVIAFGLPASFADLDLDALQTTAAALESETRLPLRAVLADMLEHL